ncbi:hypothetical protein AMATHDRAFT_61218 [Amanita thiersii Skay4041]|uniref:DUF6534 domain-containing protein n=1 Tax=Amanita thiersii Skay4041 TaxID=703135 RepID=A0A2A9NPY9_9AGAR|nr:hypothetical protein AMATHDRAFT_61218 [Amanita thiersii Skay4041]
MSGHDFRNSLGAAFFGYVLGVVLYGISIMQVYVFFIRYPNDALFRKVAITVLCVLDTLHLAFSTHMIYFFLIEHLGDFITSSRPIWSLKALGIVQVLTIWLVQFLYLGRIWRLTSSSHFSKSKWCAFAINAGIIMLMAMAIAVGLIFIVKLIQIESILSRSKSFEWVVYLGFGMTAFVDATIALCMSILLHVKVSGEDIWNSTNNVVTKIIRYSVCTGLATSLVSIIYIILYAARPSTLYYLGIEFSITRLYTNSILAMYNARKGLRKMLDMHHGSNDISALKFTSTDHEHGVSFVVDSSTSPMSESSQTDGRITPTITHQVKAGKRQRDSVIDTVPVAKHL